MRRPSSPIALHIAAQRSVHEGKFDTRCHLLDARVVDEVRADAPVLLLQDLVVDPPAPRGLQQWVVEQATGTARPAPAPARSRRSPARTGGCARRRGTHDRVERGAAAREALGDGARVVRGTAAFAGRPRAAPPSGRAPPPRRPAPRAGATPAPRRSPRRGRAARRRGDWSIDGRICSSYSGSAPSVNSRCHQPACCSHNDGSLTAPSSQARVACPHSEEVAVYVSVLIRRLKPGKTYDDFVRAWYPDKGFGIGGRGPILARNVDDEREIVAVRVDGPRLRRDARRGDGAHRRAGSGEARTRRRRDRVHRRARDLRGGRRVRLLHRRLGQRAVDRQAIS